jgi:alpha-beta hydrolase superfamily lysophospholipase
MYRYCAATTATAMALAIGGCAALEMKERELVFRPVKEAAGWYNGTPATVQDIWLPVGDASPKERMHAWWWPADEPGAPVVLYLHGVRWNLTGHLNRMSQLRRFGFSVFAIDYRGFGKSDGELPSEATVYEDARAGWKWVVDHEPEASRRYIYGHSLGGAVAIDLAANVSNTPASARGLIVESSFTSLPELVSESGYGWLPILISQKFDSVAKIRQIAMPVLIVHGEDDRYVPPHLSSALFAAAPQPKKLLLVANGSHNNSVWAGDADYRLALDELFGPLQAVRDESGTGPNAVTARTHGPTSTDRQPAAF